MLADVDAALNASPALWFRSRTCHEYGVVRAGIKHRVDLDRARILDFGCGALPVAAASFALRHPDASVIGCDIEAAQVETVRSALREQAGLPLPQNLQLVQCAPSTLPDSAVDLDLAYSWSVFEHIPAQEVARNFALVGERLASTGVFYFQIGGLYFHTEGSHLKHLFAGEPWHHLLRPLSELEQRIFESPHPDASKQRNWRQFLELNRLVCEDFLDAASDAGLELLWESRIRDTSATVPDRLLRMYTHDALTTFEIRALFRRRGGL